MSGPMPGRYAIRMTIETLIALMDAMDGDADVEDATGLEDAFEAHRGDGPGCKTADPGGGNVADEGEAIDEREPEDAP